MKEAKIIKFGRIFENSEGILNFENFNFDGGDRFKTTLVYITLLTLVIERFEKELAKIKAIDPTVIKQDDE